MIIWLRGCPNIKVCPVYPCNGLASLGVVSQTFRELSKIISQKYAMPESIFMVKISNQNCTCAQSMVLGTRTQFQLEILTRSAISVIHKISQEVRFLQYTNSERIFWRACETLVKHPPDHTVAAKPSVYKFLCMKHEQIVAFPSTTLLIICVTALSEQIESIKPTSMEDVSTKVLEKINI